MKIWESDVFTNLGVLRTKIFSFEKCRIPIVQTLLKYKLELNLSVT